jgi:D-aminoacyl-tRNA deacylase
MMTPEGSPATVLITSTRDEASTTIAGGLVENHGFQSTEIALMGEPVFQKGSLLLVTIDTEIISPPDLDTYFNPQAYIFLSRHRAESGIPSLTVHTTGNFTDKPSLGGRPKEVGGVNPDLQKNYLIALNARRDEIKDYQITIEATHHGPTSLKRPVLFVELGSSEKDWGDEKAGKVIGDALIESLTRGRSWDRVALAFGGPHYSTKFNKLLLESDTALSSVVAKHSLDGVDSEMFGQMIQKTSRFPRFVAVDWKGMGQHREKILGFAGQFALEVIRL